MSAPSELPARPSLEHLRKQAKDLAARAGDRAAVARFDAVIARPAPGSTARPFPLADAQRVIARAYGFPNWAALAHRVERDTPQSAALDRPMIRPLELRGARPYTLGDGTVTTTETVWRMFRATRDGDVAEVRRLVRRAPALALVEYNYTPPMHFAVREGHLPLVELFAERGADLAYRSYPFGDSLLTLAEDHEHHAVAALLRERLARRFALGAATGAILQAARDGDLARVHEELARDPELARASNETGDTALHRAASHGHLEIVAALVAAGADVDAERGDGFRPTHCALMPHWSVPRERATAIATLLVAHGARRTVYIAARLGDDAFVRDALRRDPAAANAADSCQHRPLSGAAAADDLALVELLLAHGADPRLPEQGAPRGQALWTAVHRRHREMARRLLAHGADPNGMVESSGTPMMQARPDPELRDLLRRHGGVEDVTDRDRLGTLIGENDLASVERLLRERPTLMREVNDSDGEGILSGSARGGNHDMIALLLRLGARIPSVSKWAPYYYFKHEATAAFLLARGMDPNHMNWHRVTLLHHMAAEGELAKARLLLDRGADVDAIDEEYRSTPLGVAARRGQLEMVRLLLERGADPARAGAPWATPAAWARKYGHTEILALLGA